MSFQATLDYAKKADRSDPLANFRRQFHFPSYKKGKAVYLCGNSLGLQSRNVRKAVLRELEDWKNLGVNGYMNAKNPWLYYQHNFNKPLSRIVGCNENEVTVMNTLTVNLHLLMLSFYRKDPQRYKILMEAGAFPSDQYAVETQVKLYNHDPADAIIEVAPRQGEKTLRTEDIISAIERNKETLSLVLLGGINYYTGQLYDIQAITVAAHASGAYAGFDLAHAVGNVPLHLHDWGVDFAAWCSYKYLNGGPGAVGGLFIHEKYSGDLSYPRLAGWWGNDEATRFKMEKGFIPRPGAAGWNVSTAQVFNMVSLKASLELIDKAGIENLHFKSLRLTGYLEFLLSRIRNLTVEIITPSDPLRRGAQLSLFFKEKGKEIHAKMTAKGIVVDYREPGVIRVAPAPLYNSFEDVYRFYDVLRKIK